jgi:hypothetical protein
MTAQALVDDSIVTERLIAQLSASFVALTVLLAAIGLYGVMSYTVAGRTAEIGVRHGAWRPPVRRRVPRAGRDRPRRRLSPCATRRMTIPHP